MRREPFHAGPPAGFALIRYHPFDPMQPTLPDLADAYKHETPDNFAIEADGQPVYSRSSACRIGRFVM